MYDAETLQKFLKLSGIIAWTIVTPDLRGKLNSEIITESAMHMAVDVEFGNFLTKMYFENTSATNRKSILSH